MPPPLSTTSYALLGLLAFDSATSSDGLTGYELKQRADRTLRFYWTSPATSQIYTEVDRLASAGYVSTTRATTGKRDTTRVRLNPTGRTALIDWLRTPTDEEFPVLKHPVALRLLMGSLMEPADVRAMLDRYLRALEQRRLELEAVREMLGDNPDVVHPAMVADWGLAYYDSEAEITDRLRRRLPDTP